MHLFTLPITRLGAFIHDRVEGFGHFTRFAGAVLYWILAQPGSWLRWRNLAPQLYNVGVLSIPVVAITGMFIGMILALEGFAQFAAIGQEDRIGGVINASVTSRSAPCWRRSGAGRVGGALPPSSEP